MDKPRIFLGSSGKQEKLLQALTRGLDDVAHVEPWTTSFNPGTTTLERLLELTREVDFAVFVFAQDDWTTTAPAASPAAGSGQASPRDNVVFEAGLFGAALGMRRTFILHASGSKLPTDLLGLTCVRYGDATTAAEMRVVNQKLRKAIEDEGRLARIEGDWWQYSLTERSELEPSAVSLLRISRDRDGALEVTGRSWQEDGSLSARYWSEAAKERKEPSGIFYYFKGERPRDPNAPQLDGTGEILLESADRAAGYFTTRRTAPEGQRADVRRLLARPAGGHEHPGRRRRSAARRVDRRAADAVEVDHERLSAVVGTSDWAADCLVGQSEQRVAQPVLEVVEAVAARDRAWRPIDRENRVLVLADHAMHSISVTVRSSSPTRAAGRGVGPERRDEAAVVPERLSPAGR